MIITGQYGKTIFRDQKTGRVCFTFITKDLRPCKVRCEGVCQAYSTDMPLKLTGELGSAGIFKFTSCVPCVNSKERLVTFLSGDDFKGIGEKTAERIYEFVEGDIFAFAFKSDAEEILAREFTRKIAKEIITKIRMLEGANKIYKCIEKFGGTIHNAVRISEMVDYNDFLANIYKFGREGGLSFGCCDAIAKSRNWSPYNKKRLTAILDEVIKSIVDSGHSYANSDEIMTALNFICKSSAYTEVIPAPYMLSFAVEHPKFKILEENGEIRYYSSFVHKAESSVANNILRLTQSAVALPFNEDMIAEIECECGIKYADSQRKSFNMLKTSGVKILTGGPGTGKSTVIKGIIQAIKKMFPDEVPLLCAPTGRAAQRLKEVTGEDSFTIHKALNILPFENGVISSDPVDSKFIIIDEASMIDILLLDTLLKSVSTSSFVLFCGDINQLPSVGPGNILQDMIDSKKIEVTVLDVVFRQLEDSLINYHAHQIRTGKTLIKEGKDFHFYSFKTEDEIRNKVAEIAREKYDANDIFDFQVLVPCKEGEAGVRALNRLLQPICNTTSDAVTSSAYRLKKSDKIIMMRNNYAGGYLNGDIGIIKEILEDAYIISLGDGKDIEVKRSNWDDIAPAYALTVHKSQGSEFSAVVVVLPEEPWNMLQRNLLYTAVTRAKKEIFVVSQNDAYAKAIRNTKINKRKTSLKEKIERNDFIYD